MSMARVWTWCCNAMRLHGVDAELLDRKGVQALAASAAEFKCEVVV
jgi:hypothetical protein